MLADLLTREHHSSSEVPTLNCLFSVSLLHALFGQTFVAFPFPFLRPIDFSSVSPRRAGKPTDLAGTMWKVEGGMEGTTELLSVHAPPPRSPGCLFQLASALLQ